MNSLSQPVERPALDFLFVVPKLSQPGEFSPFPIGIAYVIANLKKHGFSVQCVNSCFDHDPIEVLVAKAIREFRPRVVCTGAMSFYWGEVENVLKAVKSVDPSIRTVVGGAIVTSDPLLALRHLPMDIGIVGEGEGTMVDLAAALARGRELSAVPGLIFWNADRQPVLTSPRAPIADLDALPFPDYEAVGFSRWLSPRFYEHPSLMGVLFDIDAPERFCEILTSRSCPFSCTFCYHPLGKKYRQRSIDNVMLEMEFLRRTYGISLFNMLDELFSFDEKRVLEFAAKVRPLNIKWMAQWRVETVNEDVLRAARESGLICVGLGIESMSDPVLKSMKKMTTRAQIQQSLDMVLKSGIRPGGNLIFGDVAETAETVRESLDWWSAHREHDVHLAMILSVPDAPLFQVACRKGLIPDRLAHIQGRFQPVNVSRLSRSQYQSLKRKVALFNATERNLPPGRVLQSQFTGQFHEGRRVFSFQVKCPQCRAVSTYRYYCFSKLPYAVVLCRTCLKRVKIFSAEAFPGEGSRVRAWILLLGLIVYKAFLIDIPFIRALRRGLWKWKF